MENIFSILPMSQELSLNPGETFTGSITVCNPDSSQNDLSYTVSVSPYGVIGEDYQADITNPSIYSQIVDWITISEPTGTLAPNETRQVEFTINVPEKASPGGQYAAIMVSADPVKQSSGGIAINDVFALASVVYADIAGEAVHKGTILENSIPQFSLSAPVDVSALIDNQGNVHDTAIITIEATNAITKEKLFPTDQNQENDFYEIIMPETTRYINRSINNIPAIGVVNITQTIHYNGETSRVTKDVIICPIWFLFTIVFVTISLIICIITGIRRHRKKRKAKKVKESKNLAS